ncbi:MAG: hypothetical protein JWO38_1427 [Gemmataceae bacterium]|nr:hypothetical protein [Gemmataceae bacterium]
MVRHGTVMNGVIVPDGSATLPEGARVRFEVEEVFEYPHPLAPYDREKEVALLRERIAEQETGLPGDDQSGVPLDDVPGGLRPDRGDEPVSVWVHGGPQVV